jgi:hypothetical protein
VVDVDSELQDLAEASSLNATDLLYIVVDPDGTPIAKGVPTSVIDARYLVEANNLSDLPNAGTARTNLGVAIGSDVQAYDAGLADVAGLAVTKGNVIIADGSNWLALGIGGDTEILTADSGEASGVKWAAPAGGSNWSVAGNLMQPAVDGDGVLIDVPTASREALILKTTDDDTTKSLQEWQDSSGNVCASVNPRATSIDELMEFTTQDASITHPFIFSNEGSIILGELRGAAPADTYYRSVAIGRGALGSTTHASSKSVAIGYQALNECDTGSQNLAVGHAAGRTIGSGSSNVAIGNESLQALTDGSNNFGMGASCFKNLGSGQYNVGLGTRTFEDNTGDGNIGIGYYCGRQNITGNWNIYIGKNTGDNSLGDGNILMGNSYNGRNIDGGDYNICVGFKTYFVTHAKWDVTGDFDDTGGNAIYNHSGGSGTLTQTAANMATALVGNEWYLLTYEIRNYTNTNFTAHTLTTGIVDTAITLPIKNLTTHTVVLYTKAVPGDFVISVTSDGTCDFLLDNISLKPITGGDLDAIGDLTAGTIQADDGFTGNWVNNEGDTVTVAGGVITDVS